MVDKRDIKRLKKRLSIRFGIEDANRVAFTEDISSSGMFIKTANVCPPNTKIKIEFMLNDGNKVELEARVMWAKKVPQNLFHLVKKSGMGVRFTGFSSGEPDFRRFCENILAGQQSSR
ncbi:MAG TPA: PilZ domain-containing protein [Desulfuromonadaceae bacterium]